MTGFTGAAQASDLVRQLLYFFDHQGRGRHERPGHTSLRRHRVSRIEGSGRRCDGVQALCIALETDPRSQEIAGTVIATVSGQPLSQERSGDRDAVDNLRDSSVPVAVGHGLVLHDGRVHPPPAADRAGCDPDPGHPGTQTGFVTISTAAPSWGRRRITTKEAI